MGVVAAAKTASLSISMADYLADPSRFSAVLDARSPAEYALDHIPSAQSSPVLSDAQRVTVGTLDKQSSSFEAKRVGAALVARNIADLLESPAFDQPRSWTPLVYCWRGGNRSGSLVHILRKIGWPALQLAGGYKAFRAQVMADLSTLPQTLQYLTVAGATGTGKTRLLQALAAQGAQVLDLEAIARHRGSVLGGMSEAQPTQKAFDTQVWAALRAFDAAKPVFVESESAKVGNVRVPEALLTAMRASPCVQLRASQAQRVALLCEEYKHFLQDTALLNTQLARLTTAYGYACVAAWQAQAAAGEWQALVADLLVRHYDPAYQASLRRNYVQIDTAFNVDLLETKANDAQAAGWDFEGMARDLLDTLSA